MFRDLILVSSIAATLKCAQGIFLQPVRSHVTESCPAMFVAVLSRKNETQTRTDIREMWKTAGNSWGAKITAKFAVCRHAEEVNAPSQKGLQEEADTYGDILEMNCTDKYESGGLTRKVRDLMQVYVKDYMATHPLFMKIDDDTFVSPGKLCNSLMENWTPLSRMEGLKVYMGVFYEQPEIASSSSVPVRDPGSKWYEPWKTYWKEFYPFSAKGGTGYVLSGELVQQFFEKGIIESNMLWNEDKAVGVWVEKVKQAGLSMVDYVNVEGTDGYYFHEPFWGYHKKGKWSSLPYTLWHKLSGSTIKCLHELEVKGDPEAKLDDCWT